MHPEGRLLVLRGSVVAEPWAVAVCKAREEAVEMEAMEATGFSVKEAVVALAAEAVWEF
jgi:hypothetical protein